MENRVVGRIRDRLGGTVVSISPLRSRHAVLRLIGRRQRWPSYPCYCRLWGTRSRLPAGCSKHERGSGPADRLLSAPIQSTAIGMKEPTRLIVVGVLALASSAPAGRTVADEQVPRVCHRSEQQDWEP